MGYNTDSDNSVDGIGQGVVGTKRAAGRSLAQQLRTIILVSVLMCFVSTVGFGWLLYQQYQAGLLVESSETELTSVDMKLAEHIHAMRFGVIQVQQWLTDISATRGLDGLDDGFDEALASAEAFKMAAGQALEIARSHGLDDIGRQIEVAQDAFPDY